MTGRTGAAGPASPPPPATSGDLHVRIDEPRDEPGATEVDDLVERARQQRSPEPRAWSRPTRTLYRPRDAGSDISAPRSMVRDLAW